MKITYKLTEREIEFLKVLKEEHNNRLSRFDTKEFTTYWEKEIESFEEEGLIEDCDLQMFTLVLTEKGEKIQEAYLNTKQEDVPYPTKEEIDLLNEDLPLILWNHNETLKPIGKLTPEQVEEFKRVFSGISNSTPVSFESQERFKLPNDNDLVAIALLFNDGKVQKQKLGDMVAMAQFIVDRLYENGDVTKRSSKEK